MSTAGVTTPTAAAPIAAISARLDEPSARGLATAVSAGMRAGELLPGTRLPPIRVLADALDLSPTTVSAAWSLLRRSGTVRTDGRRGSVIGDAGGASGPHRLRRTVDRGTRFDIDLSGGVPDPTLLPDLARAVRAVAADGATASPASYLDPPTLPELQAVLVADWPFRVDEVLVVDGAMDGIELTARTLLQYGDRVLVEDPGFPPILDLLESLGVRAVPVRMDADGLMPAELEAALAQPAVALILQPRAQNPTGVSMTSRRERELAAVLAGSDITIIEDDSAGGVAWSAPRSLGRHLPEQTVHVRSFAKSHGPDLRLAALSAPEPLRAMLIGRRELGQGWTSRLLQRLLLSLLTDPESVAEVTRARTAYRDRRSAFRAALAQRGVRVGGTDGINAWVPVADETGAVLRLATRGIGVAPGSPFMLRPGAQDYIRVTCGLVGPDLERVADEIAAAGVAAWAARR